MRVFILIIIGCTMLSCVQDTYLKTVTFKVDMRAIENPENVGVRGNFTTNPWTETVLLTDANNDGIFEGTISDKTANNQIQFKFVNQNSNYELKDFDNRVIQFKQEPETMIYKAIFNDQKGHLSIQN